MVEKTLGRFEKKNARVFSTISCFAAIHFCKHDPWLLDSWFASMRLFSSVLMCVPGGIISSKIGRCKIIIFSVPFVLAGWLLISFAATKIMLFSGRILTCLFVSLYFTSTGVYISETVHPDIRGSLVILSPFFMASGNYNYLPTY